MIERAAFSFVTDTGTMCVFDLASLKSRLGDDADWWCTPQDELNELNAGRCMFIGLGGDGNFNVHISQSIDKPQLKLNFAAPSGRVFLGAAEEVTADGREPEAVRGGGFVNIVPGSYTLSVRREGSNVTVAFSRQTGGITNFLSTPIFLDSQ